MPDATRMPDQAPRDWAEAFAALPQETPQRDAWAKIAAEIRPAASASSSPARRHRRPLWLAVAAAVALAIALPLFWRPTHDATPQPAIASKPASPPRDAQMPARTVAQPAPQIASVGTENSGGVKRTASDTRVAQRPAKRPGKKVLPAAIAASPDATALAALYAQSAQLEALLAQVQDDRVVTGPAAAMADELEARVADIDASLSQSDLAARQRAALWRDRVDALQQLAGFHSTQRLLAADGERYDGQLVAVY